MFVVCAWCQKEGKRKILGQIPPYDDTSNESHGICEKHAKEWKEGKANPMQSRLKKGSPEAFAWARKMQAARGKSKRKSRKNPGARYHEVEAELEETTERKARTKGKTTQAAFHRGKAAAHRQSEAAARSFGMNPPKKFTAGIAGIVYNRLLEIRAEKTQHKPGFYKHPFKKNSGAQILALDNGDLLIHSTSGRKLWGLDR